MGTTTNRAQVIIEAVDRASAKFGKIAAVVSAFGVTAAAVGAIQLGRKLTSGLIAAANAAGEQEAAVAQLSNALRLTGAAVQSTLPQLTAQASKLQDLTGVGDELILSNQALLISLGKLKGEGLQRATQAALDLAAATGVSTKSAFDLVAKAASGYTSTLSRYGIILDENLPKEKKFAAALAKIEEVAGGAAAAALDTFAGRVREFEGRIGDLREAIGGPFAEIAEIFLRDVLSPLAKSLTTLIDESDDYRTSVFNAAIATLEFVKAVQFLATRGVNNLKNSNLFFVGKTTFKALASAIPGATDAFKEFADSIGLVTLDELKKEYDEFSSALDPVLDKLKKARDAGKDESGNQRKPLDLINPNTPEIVEVSALKFITLAEAVDQAAFSGSVVVRRIGELGDKIEVSGRRVELLGITIKRVLRDVGVDSALKFSDTLVEAAFEGKEAFKDFFKQLLADLARAIARALILRAVLAFVNFVGGGAGGAAAEGAADGVTTVIPKSAFAGIGRGDLPFAPGTPISFGQNLVDYILDSTAKGGGTMTIELRSDIPQFVERVNRSVKTGSVRVVATEFQGSRDRR